MCWTAQGCSWLPQSRAPLTCLLGRLCLQLDGELEAALGLLDTILAKNPSGLTQYIPVLVESFLPLLKSPLAAPRIKNPFLSLAACVMPPRLKALGQSLFAGCEHGPGQVGRWVGGAPEHWWGAMW